MLCARLFIKQYLLGFLFFILEIYDIDEPVKDKKRKPFSDATVKHGEAESPDESKIKNSSLERHAY